MLRREQKGVVALRAAAIEVSDRVVIRTPCWVEQSQDFARGLVCAVRARARSRGRQSVLSRGAVSGDVLLQIEFAARPHVDRVIPQVRTGEEPLAKLALD